MIARSSVCTLILVALAHVLPVSAAIYYVDVTATGADNGTTWPDAFVDLQSALATATDGDEIWVAAGEYSAGDDVASWAPFQLVDGVAVFGGFAGDESSREERDPELNITILTHRVSDANGLDWNSAIVIADGVSRDAVLDGVTISNPLGRVAGMRCVDAGPTVTGVTFTRDGALWWEAPALYNLRSHPLVSDSQVQHHHHYFGAVHNVQSSPVFRSTRFEDNYGAAVGAMLNEQGSVVEIVDCVFEGNSTPDNTGALSSRNSTIIVARTRFEQNFAGVDVYWAGAAVSNDQTTAHFVDCEFVGNQAYDSVNPAESVELYGMAMGNRDSEVSIVNCAFVGQDGALGTATVASSGTSLTVVNSVFWSNSGIRFDGTEVVPTPELYSDPTSIVTVANSIVARSGGSGAGWDDELGTDLGGNFDLDPRFVDPVVTPYGSTGDLRLLLASPAIEAGIPTAPYLPVGFSHTLDLTGLPRTSGTSIDIGPHEYQFESCPTAQVDIGPSWDGIPLQGILDATYGPGKINAATDYSGYTCGDPIQAYWLDSNVNAWLVREIATNRNANVFGWHVEDFAAPLIDGTDDGVIFTGPIDEGATANITFSSAQRFGFYLDPSGPGDATNAPQPEHFFTNRIHNDSGPHGSGAAHQPFGGDVQCLIYDISHLRGGKPTYVLAWEDLDAGGPVTATYTPSSTDNDFNDLVVEIQAESPVPAVIADLSAERFEFGVRLQWTLTGGEGLLGFEVQRRPSMGGFDTIATLDAHDGRGEWTDTSSLPKGRYEYRVAARFETGSLYSQAAPVEIGTTVPLRNQLVRAVPNPFNPKTRIEYALAEAGRVELRVYDLAGRLVRELEIGQRGAGSHFVEWDGQDEFGKPVASGVYLVRMHAGASSDAMRVVLLK